MRPPKSGTIRARVLELLAERPGLTTREISQVIRPDDPEDTATGVMLRKWRGVDFRSEPVPAGVVGNRQKTHRWYRLEVDPRASSEPIPGEFDGLVDDCDLVLGALGLEVDLTRDEAIVQAKGIRSTLAAVLETLGPHVNGSNVVDAIEELQRQVEDAKSKHAPTPGVPAPQVWTFDAGSAPRSGVLAEVEARADTWRAAHEQLARQFAEAVRK